MHQTSPNYFRQQLISHINGGEAFTPIDKLLDKISFQKCGIIPEGLPYSLWQQLYHIRYTQLDILEFIRNSAYKAPDWPDDYWPSNPYPDTEQEWEDMKKWYSQERRAIIDIVKDESIDLFKPFPQGKGQTVFREALLIIEHTAYHTGQMLILMRLLDLYK